MRKPRKHEDNPPHLLYTPKVVFTDPPEIAHIRRLYHQGRLGEAADRTGIKLATLRLGVRRGRLSKPYMRILERVELGIIRLCPEDADTADCLKWHSEFRSQIQVAHAIRVNSTYVKKWVDRVDLDIPERVVKYVDEHMRGKSGWDELPRAVIAVNTQRISFDPSETAPVLAEDCSDEDVMAVFRWHYVRRGLRNMARQMHRSNEFLCRIHTGAAKPPPWFYQYAIDWLAGKRANEPIPSRELEFEWKERLERERAAAAEKEAETTSPTFLSWADKIRLAPSADEIAKIRKAEEAEELFLPPAGKPKMDARAQMYRRWRQERWEQQQQQQKTKRG